MKNYSIKVSKNGRDVSSGQIRDLIFDSEFKTFNIVKQGIYQLKVLKNSEEETILIEHGLDFSPAFMVWHEIYPATYTGIPRELVQVPEGNIGYNPHIWATTDENNLTIEVTHPFDFLGSVTATTNKIYYMIFNIPLEGV
jgi:hypothetical protein